MVDYTKPVPELIVDLVNTTNSINIPYVAVSITDPVINPDPVTKPREMKADVVALDGMGYLDQKTVYYNRKKVGVLLGEPLELPLPAGFDETTPFEDLLAEINETSDGTWLLRAVDFDSTQRLVFTTPQRAEFTLTALDTSPIFGGTTTVTFIQAAQSLEDLILIDILDGF